jgi:phosphate transport system protein
MSNARPILDREEFKIHDHVLKMAKVTQEAVERAMDSLKSQDAGLAQQVVEQDQKINELLRIVEHECIETLALQQPQAHDLRDIVSSMQIAAEIERIADHAKDIAKIVLGMDPGDFSGPMDRIADMSDVCVNMFTRVIEAYENRDEQLAQTAAEEDGELDDLDEEASASLLMQLMSAPDRNMHATHLLWIAYHLERIGDRITNMAERVVFMATAETPELG